MKQSVEGKNQKKERIRRRKQSEEGKNQKRGGIGRREE